MRRGPLASELRTTQSKAKRAFRLVLVLDVCVLGVNGFGGPMVRRGLDSVDRWKGRKEWRERMKERKERIATDRYVMMSIAELLYGGSRRCMEGRDEMMRCT